MLLPRAERKRLFYNSNVVLKTMFDDASQDWCVYLIENGGCTYVGMSNKPMHRLRQHNSELRGGAKYTTSKGAGWRHVLIIGGFEDKISAMQFEWAVKHQAPRKTAGTIPRLQKFIQVLRKEHWTSKARASNTYELILNWFGTSVIGHNEEEFIAEIPENCQVKFI